MPLNLAKSRTVPTDLPLAMRRSIARLASQDDRMKCLEAAYEMLASRYSGSKVQAYLKLFDAFRTSLHSLWSRNGSIHCTNFNYLLKVLLVASGRFQPSDIEFRWTAIYYFSPHQYARVRVGDDMWINVDLWGNSYGIKFGEYARGFNV